MKLIQLLIVSLLLLFAGDVSATWQTNWVVSGTWDCGGCCVEGRTTHFSGTIKNTGTDTFSIDYVGIITTDEKGVVSWSSNAFSLAPGESQNIILNGVMQSPTSGSSLLHMIRVRIKYAHWYTPNWEVENSPNFGLNPVVSAVDHECDNDNSCQATQYCEVLSTCKSTCNSVVQTTSCGYVANHKWNTYQCCADTDCAQGSTCINHACSVIPCVCGYISGHTCIKYECCANSDCGSGKFCQSNKCYDIECTTANDCADNEVCQTYQCTELTCSSGQYPKNHKCIQCENNNQCQNDETCSNNFCVKVTCGRSYYVENHACKAYECMTTTDCAGDKECTNNHCVAISCGYCEYATDHRCLAHECCTDEACKDNFYCSDKQCQELSCGALEYSDNHKCENLIVSYTIGKKAASTYYVIPLLVVVLAVIGILTVMGHGLKLGKKSATVKQKVGDEEKPATADKPTTDSAEKKA